MAKAPVDIPVSFDGFEDVKAGIVKWPMSCIRLKSESTTRLVDLASKILDNWRSYTDEASFIFAETNGEPHNTITPIARKRDGLFELDLVLRNNITTPEHPLGVYHPHSELHNIKKENIGLIEVMGLAVLPARLNTELKTLADCIVAGKDIKSDESISKHADWVEGFKSGYSDINEGNVMKILCAEVGKVFSKVLEHAGVYKTDDEGRKAFLKFINSVK
jgi:UDPglucose--hexose-1-phosphate uridylyltransferase